MLWSEAVTKGYRSPIWMTFNRRCPDAWLTRRPTSNSSSSIQGREHPIENRKADEGERGRVAAEGAETRCRVRSSAITRDSRMAVRLSCFIELSPKDSVSTVWFTLGIAAQHDRRLPTIGAVASCQAVAKRMPSSARSASRRWKGGWIGKDPRPSLVVCGPPP